MRLGRILQQNLRYEDLQRIRATNVHVSVNKATLYRKPLAIRNASMQWMYDLNGKKYLDFFGGIVTVGVGHCHPKVNDALIQQINKVWHTTNIYYNEPFHAYAEKLASTLPGDLKTVYLVNSGSEANDLALLMARVSTGNYDVIALRNGYHGMSPNTMGLTGHSTWKQNSPHYFGIHHAMNPDVYKGIWGGESCRDSPVQTDRKCACSGGVCQAADKYVEQLEEVLTYSVPQRKVAAMFIESIQGVGGVVQYPKGYVKKAQDLIRKNGGVIISDEVQTGFGRTGDHLWNFESHGIIPDIVTMAKSIGNGFPMAAVVTTPKIAQSLANASHFNTFGGNPMASAVGKAVLEVIEEEKLQQHCKTVGTYFLKELEKFRAEFSNVGDVRGKGFMIGIEMVENKETRKQLALEKVLDIFEDLKDEGLLVGRGGHYGNVFRLSPPMCATKADVDFALPIFRKVFKKHAT
ncbi:alanine--glyoxylate aminotransferase 2, mitochondrial [Folsomia candida]|uniref:Alanine--glyoxylate aminotransferase 2, mitochondrial n=1 Tax=Folsomia candida TaxID=158441 RepID=A0A226DS77_FOLCA|nr:alanine--glyoxylate aminotransferase 2, mitochondrial [Folsomia candida]OXA47066.1 Alanine--glyoxylate aminotransferase 2, mitochondrial [Folsomia candida]